MNTRKLLFLGLIGFYSCMPIQASYYTGWQDQRKDSTWTDKVVTFLDRHGDELAMIGLNLGAMLVSFYFIFKMQESLLAGDNKFTLHKAGTITTTFDDVIGAQEAKDSLLDVIEYLKNPKVYENLNIHIPAGVLLVGEPGNGKTLLARAVAGEAGVNFISVSGAQFIEMFVGTGAARVRKLFNFAKANSPCIIFIDEIDSIGRKRSAGANGEEIQTINELLNQLDGFNKAQYPIVIMAATNNVDMLDEALIRPGRFDRTVYVSHPSFHERELILELYLKNKTHLLTQNDITRIAQLTVGFSGAQLENLVNQAALLAAKRKAVLSRVDFDQATDLLVFGGQRNITLTHQMLERVAYHEAGHTLIALHNEPILGSTFHKVTIIPRGGALGSTYSLPSEESVYLQTKDQLLAYIRMLLGGYVAEELIYGQTSTGVADDLKRASSYARQMVTIFGMHDGTGKVSYNLQTCRSDTNYSQDTLQKIDAAAQQIIQEQYEWVKAFLLEHKASLKLVGDTLLQEETLTDKQIKELLGIENSSQEAFLIA